jgi:hypothetical protein
LFNATVTGTLSPDVKLVLGFDGIVMADDLDSMATMRGDSVAAVAIDALNAGCDFLLLADTGTNSTRSRLPSKWQRVRNDFGRGVGKICQQGPGPVT